MILGEALQAARLRNGWTQQEAAFELQIPITTLQNYERGRTIPSLERLWRLCDLYYIPVATLLHHVHFEDTFHIHRMKKEGRYTAYAPSSTTETMYRQVFPEGSQ